MSAQTKHSRLGLSTRVREHVRAHPGCDSHQVAAALGEDTRSVAHRLCQLAQYGVVRSEPKPRVGPRTPSLAYHFVREVREVRPPAGTPEQRAQRRRLAQRDYDRQRGRRVRGSALDPNAPQRIASDRAWVKAQLAAVEAKSPKRPASQSSEDFIASGGDYAVLPGFVHQPDFRRRAIQHRRVQGES